jgi:hypothetical protein
MTVEMLTQTAPYPDLLDQLVKATSYRPGWKVWLQDMQRDEDHGRGESKGLTLVIRTLGYNSYHPDQGETYRVHHYFIVPAATYDERSWRRWLFEQFCLVERHEAMEYFQIDGVRPYAPSHGPGNDPYMVREVGTDLDQRTRFTGDVIEK